MNSITLPVELARELADNSIGTSVEGWTVVQNILDSSTRWSLIFNLVIENESGEFYATSYSVGATEIQDERPWEYEPEAVFERVRPVQVVVTEFVPF